MTPSMVWLRKVNSYSIIEMDFFIIVIEQMGHYYNVYGHFNYD